MSKAKIIFTFFCFLLSISIIMSSCSQNDCRRTVFENDFKNGNNNTFLEYGNIVESFDSLTLYSIDNIGPLTYFGKNESKNSTFTNSGLHAEITMDLNIDEINDNEYFCWNIALNSKDNEILANLKVYFKKVNEKIEIYYEQNSQNSDVLLSLTKSGEYIFEISFYSSVKDNILFSLTLKDKNNKKILSSVGNEFKLGEENIKTKEVGGIRYAWLSEMTIEKLIIKKVRLLEN